MPELLDLSHYQAPVDFARVKAAGIVGVICKATQGGGYTDPTYVAKCQAARTAGLLVGAYHFADPDSAAADPEAEAAHFLGVQALARTDLRPALDLERTTLPASVTDDWALRWLHAVAAAGVQPMVYTGPSWAAAHLDPNPALAAYPLWVAHWTTKPTPTLPAPWTGWVLWQYGGSAVPGIPGDVDRDRCPTVEPLLANPTPPPPDHGAPLMEIYKAPTRPDGTHLWYLLNGPDDGAPQADWREVTEAAGLTLVAQGTPFRDYSANPDGWAILVLGEGAPLGPARELHPAGG